LTAGRRHGGAVRADGKVAVGGRASYVKHKRAAVAGRVTMNEDRFNMDLRKFLKVVGVTSQRQIELAVRTALANGTIAETALLKAKVTLSMPEIGLDHVVDGEIALS
jgi:hypothetical protein